MSTEPGGSLRKSKTNFSRAHGERSGVRALVTAIAARPLLGNPWNAAQIMGESARSVNLLWNRELGSDEPGSKWLRNQVGLGTIKRSDFKDRLAGMLAREDLVVMVFSEDCELVAGVSCDAG